jgi:ABC-type transport system involved in cytochrome bd biosynthesis fused ATPase/permease subunit
MRILQKLFEGAYVVIVLAFLVIGVTLMVFAVGEVWSAVRPAGEVDMHTRFVAVLEGIGLLTIAVAALELGQTILEEEVQRSSTISAPTRVRRFLSRFIVVVVVALSIECLVAVFEFIHDSPQLLPHAASVGVAAAALLAAWGVFVRLNIAAESLEPEALKNAKDEDEKIEDKNDETAKDETAKDQTAQDQGAQDQGAGDATNQGAMEADGQSARAGRSGG